MKKILLLVITGLLLLSGCSSKPDEILFSEVDNIAFKEHLDELLVTSLNPSDLSVNFSFIDPEAAGITPEPYELGFTTLEDFNESNKETQTMIDQLKEFKDQDLSIQQQMDRNALIDLFERSVALSEFYDYEIGTSVLGSSRALMGNIPAYLEKYEFTLARDVDYYLHFIETLEGYFKDYVALEHERQERDTGYSQYELDAIIEQAQNLADEASSSDYYLIEEFEEKLAATAFGSPDLIERNKRAINDSLASAYQAIADGLSDIEGPEMRGYAQMPKGKEYYTKILEYNTGSSRSIKDIQLVNSRLKMKSLLKIQSIAQDAETQEAMFDQYINGPDLPYDNGKDLIDVLNISYQKYFPQTDPFNYELRRVHPSMEEGSAPAFYFTPQIDYTSDYKQVIFAKGDYKQEDYKTFGHEATPGHMYQFTYFNTLESHPVMKMFTSGANAEGWANYSEQYVDLILGVDEDQANYNVAYNAIIQSLHIELDLGINHSGWDMDQAEEFVIENFGEQEGDAMKELYLLFVHNPAVYPTYYLSSLYIEELKTMFFKESEEGLTDVDFHKAFLKYGSVGFDIINEGFKKDLKK